MDIASSKHLFIGSAFQKAAPKRQRESGSAHHIFVILMEIETKFKTDNLEEIKNKLIGMGAVFSEELEQIDEYYKPKGRETETQKPGSFLLRIRIQGNKKFFTCKALTDRTGVWDEHEMEISDENALREILKKLNYTMIFSITKKRANGRLNEFGLCIDKVKELGNYLEVEIISDNGEEGKHKISALLKKLGAAEKNMEHRGYAAILSQRMGVKFEGTNG